MIPTPSLRHLSAKDYEVVYEPAEDSFLMLDALEKDAEELRTRRPRICLEIGSGSGCISTFLAQLLGPSEAVYYCVDINPQACKISERTGEANKVILDVINGDLALNMLPKLQNQVDVLIFNPPYVVTSSEELHAAGNLERSWAGGIDGREVIDRFMSQCGPQILLSTCGVFYLVLIQANHPEEIQAYCREQYNMDSTICMEHRTGIERLKVVKFWRRK